MREALCIGVSVIIKSSIHAGHKTIWVEISNEEPDSEGDVILQSALLESADYFLAQGHVDIDHISEIGDRFYPPIRNKQDYIIGKPESVEDMGGGRTAVVWRLADGQIAKEFWASLISQKGLPWRASIYGFPTPNGVSDCAVGSCGMGATRYLVSGIEWKSLAMTQHPVNEAIRGSARVVTEKAFIKALSKVAHAGSNLPDTLMTSDSMNPPEQERTMSPDGGLNSLGANLPVLAMANGTMSCSRETLWDEFKTHIGVDCPYCMEVLNVVSIRDHFMRCDGLDFGKADILALALIHLLNRP